MSPLISSVTSKCGNYRGTARYQGNSISAAKASLCAKFPAFVAIWEGKKKLQVSSFEFQESRNHDRFEHLLLFAKPET
jgi:hypothetical protein